MKLNFGRYRDTAHDKIVNILILCYSLISGQQQLTMLKNIRQGTSDGVGLQDGLRWRNVNWYAFANEHFCYLDI